MEQSTVRYLAYRCHRCHRTITKLEIQEAWAKSKALDTDGKTHLALCLCGSRHISPTNLSVWEEITSLKVWKLWWVEIARPWILAHLHV